MSEIDEMISEKNDLFVASSVSSNTLACLSHNAAARMSANLMVPFDELYMNRLQWLGWNSALVMTSVNSSMFVGLMSTMLKLWSLIARFHRLILRSSDDMYVSASLFSDTALMWYACAFENTRRVEAAYTVSLFSTVGSTRSFELFGVPLSALYDVTFLIFFSNIFHNLIVFHLYLGGNVRCFVVEAIVSC